MPRADTTTRHVATHARLRWIGRTVESPEGAVSMAYPGVTLRLRWSGPAPTLHFVARGEHNRFELACAGWQSMTITLPVGASSLPIPAGVAPESGWDLELARRNEAWQGTCDCTHIELPPGCELLQPPAASRRLLFLGNSITCGVGVERVPPLDDPSPRTSNAVRAFALLTARALGADAHLVAYAGRGILRDWEGRTATNNVPQFWPLALPDDPASHWDHARFQPHAVVVCVGANDLNLDLPPMHDFVSAYQRQFDVVRAAHPDAVLLLMESPIFGDEPGTKGRGQRDYLRAALEQIVAARNTRAAEPRTHFVPIGYYSGTALDPHPIAFQHEQIAAELLPHLRAALKW